MPLIKTPDGGFYISSDDFNVNYEENSITIKSSGGGSGVVGVSSFNGRTGAVVPQNGDYTAEQVGARASDWMPAATDVGAVPLTGGTMTGPLILNADATNNLGAVTKQYLDNSIDAVEDSIAAIVDGTTPIPVATTAKAGIVKQATAVADSSGATDTALETVVNNLLVALREAGILAPNA